MSLPTDRQAREAELAVETYLQATKRDWPSYGNALVELYTRGFQAATALSEESEKRIRDAANELLDEIDSCLELGGPSYEGADPLREALEPEETK